MPEKKDFTPKDKNTVPAGEIPSPPHDDLDLDFPETEVTDEAKRIATGAENALNAATPGGSPAEPGAPDIWGSDPSGQDEQNEEALSDEEWEGLLIDEDPTEFPPPSAQKPIADVPEVADDQSDRTSGQGQKDANTPPPIPDHAAEQHPDTTAPSTDTQTTGAQPEPQGSDDPENWDNKSRWGSSNGRICETNSAETQFFADKGRTTATRAAEEAVEDQRVIDKAAREAAAEALEFDPARQIRIRTWLAAIAALAAIGAASFFAGRETAEPGNNHQRNSQMSTLLKSSLDKAEADLAKAKQQLTDTEEKLSQARLRAENAQLDLDTRTPTKTIIQNVPLKQGGRGRYCPVDTFALAEQMAAEGYKLVDIRKGEKPSYLFMRQLGDLTQFVRVFIRKTSPKVRWDQFKEGQFAAVQAVEWIEAQEGQEQ